MGMEAKMGSCKAFRIEWLSLHMSIAVAKSDTFLFLFFLFPYAFVLANINGDCILVQQGLVFQICVPFKQLATWKVWAQFW